MSLWIKICGNTSLADAQMAAHAGADALGFVFAASPRRVTPAEVASIVPHLSAGVEKVGVFVNAGVDEICSTVRACGLTGVQLHFEASEDMPAKLHKELGPALRILHVVHFGIENAERVGDDLAVLAQNAHVDAVVVDSRTRTAVGGTGTTYDWEAGRKAFDSANRTARIVVAGGLNPENVAEAIATLEPWGVDVVSGVEVGPGRKDPILVRRFVERARAARA
jgi:phosphoribosylanthranilate isomerase